MIAARILTITLALIAALAPPVTVTSQRVNSLHNATWYEAELDIIPRKTYPACAYDIHSLVNTPVMWYLSGQNGTNAAAITKDGWYSTDAFDLSSNNVHLTAETLVTGEQIPVRRAGSAVYLANGNLILMGGKTTNSVYLQEVYYSSDLGQTWRASATNSANMWSARSDMTVCAMPNSNTIFAASGVSSAGAQNDVWISTDGTGAVRTPVQTSGFGDSYQSGSCVGLYDSSYVSSNYNTPNSTLIVLDNDSVYYVSTDLGATFRGLLAPWPDRNFMVIVADRDNYVYVLGGQNVVNNNVYFSQDKGFSWTILGFVNNFGIGDLYWQQASTSCGAIHVREVNGTYYKQLTVYGGTITLAQSATSVATIYGAIHGRLSLPYHSLVPGPAVSSTAAALTWSSSSSASLVVDSSSASPQIIYVDRTESGRTSVGLTVGMAFLGLGVGLIIAACLALLFCRPHFASAAKNHSKLEPSQSRGNHEMELSAVENDTN